MNCAADLLGGGATEYLRDPTYSPQLRIPSTAELTRDKLTAVTVDEKTRTIATDRPVFSSLGDLESSISHRRDQCTLLAHWTLPQTLLLPRTTPLAVPFRIALVAAAPALWKQEQHPSRRRPVHGRVRQQRCVHVVWLCFTREMDRAKDSSHVRGW